MEIDIVINNTDIFEKIKMFSSFEGDNESDTGSLYDVLTVLERHKPLIDEYIEDAKRVFKSVFREFVLDDGSLKLILPDSFNDSLKNDVMEGLNNFVISHAMMMYLNMKKADSSKYKAQAESELDNVKRKIYYRTKPKKQ